MGNTDSGVVLNDKRTIAGWALFDWANSAYALVITVAIFPAYFLSVTDDIIHVGGYSLPNSSLYAYSISAAYILIAFFSPMLSGIADFGGRKMLFLRFFTTIGSIACASLFFFKGMNQLALGTGGFILATIGFSGGLVFYNSYLPEIATEDQYDRISAKGFSYGYLGSVILLIINLIVITKPDWFGIKENDIAVRLAFVMVGLWWFGFAQITFKRLPQDPHPRPKGRIIMKGDEEIRSVWRALKHQHNTKGFLMAFFFYSAGVQTVLYLASTFAEKELHFNTTELITIILLLQVVAIGGAHFFARLSGFVGNKRSLLIMLLIWTMICLLAFFVERKIEFYLIAAGVGIVMGGIQSLSRSTYSKLLPDGTKDTTSYFSFYDVLEKSAIVLGTFSFGFIEQISGGMRNSVLALALFFIAGLIILSFVKIKHGVEKV